MKRHPYYCPACLDIWSASQRGVTPWPGSFMHVKCGQALKEWSRRP